MADKRRTILAVDDEPDVLEQIQEILEAKYDVVAARNFEDAVRAFDKKPPDLAVLDIMGVNGEELLSRFRARAPCVMLTAHALTPQHLKQSAKGGARLYLPKDELARLPEYIEQVFAHPRETLWRWLLGRLNFARWFGPAWTKEDDKWLMDITIDEIEQDLYHRYDSTGE